MQITNDIQTSQKAIWKVVDAANRLSISRSLLYELIRANKIRAVKIGRATRILESEIQRFLEEISGEADRG